MRGQLSAEMLILIVVVMAVVAIVSMQLLGSAKQTSANLGKQTDRLNEMTTESIKSEEGGFCITDDDCRSPAVCDENYRCN